MLNWYTDILLAIGKAGKFEGMQAPSTKKRTYENLSQETHDWQKTEALWNKISIGPAEASGWSCQLINLLGESAKVRVKNKGCMPNACRTRRKLQRIMPPCFCKSLASINSPWLHHSPHHYRLTPLPDLSLKNIPTSMDKAWQATADWVHWNGAFERGSGRIFLASTFHWDRNCNLISWDITWHLVPLLAKEPGPTPWKVTSRYTRLQIESQTLLRLREPSRTSNKGSLQFEPSMEMLQMMYWIQLSFKSSVPTVKLDLNAAQPWLAQVSHVLPAAITLPNETHQNLRSKVTCCCWSSEKKEAESSTADLDAPLWGQYVQLEAHVEHLRVAGEDTLAFFLHPLQQIFGCLLYILSWCNRLWYVN